MSTKKKSNPKGVTIPIVAKLVVEASSKSLWLGVIQAALLAALLIVALAKPGHTAPTNVGSIAVGSETAGTYAVVTGVATVKHPIDLQSIMISTYAAPGVSVITTDLYVAGATGLTNTPAITFPSQPASTVGVLRFRVPDNYRSGGVLRALVHASSTVTANGISVTANAFKVTPDGLTATTQYDGTVVNFPTTANTTVNDLALTNANITFAPGDLITYKIAIAGTDAVTRQILGLYFSYRPYGVFK